MIKQDLDYERNKYLANELKKIAPNIIAGYAQKPNIEILCNQEFKTLNGDTAIADIIVKSENETTLIGVNYSTEIPDWLTIKNLAYIYNIVIKCGIKIDAVNFLFIKEKYSTENQLTNELIRVKRYTKKIKELQSRIEQDIKRAKDKLRKNALPDNKIDYYCIKPSICPFKKHCD